jgi:(p)ppGpp synthase/HD superfamily hydrolase
VCLEAVSSLERKLSTYLPASQVRRVRRAFDYAKAGHEGQLRQSGEPYISHPLAVTHILADMHMDSEGLMAALLHDVIEDTQVTRPQLNRRFGKTVSDLVDGVSKLTEIEFSSRAEQQAENFQKMALAMSRDIRVVLVSSPTGCTTCAPWVCCRRRSGAASPAKPWTSTRPWPSAWA